MQEVFEKIIRRIEVAVKSSDNSNFTNGLLSAQDIIKQEAEQYNNGWIPCSERMPEVPEEIDDDECPEFIVTIKGANKATTLKCASDGTWFDEFGNIYDVIAWQPLPTPYQQKESEKDER